MTNHSPGHPKRLWWRKLHSSQSQLRIEPQNLICGDIDHEYRVTDFINRFYYLHGGSNRYLKLPFLRFVKSLSDQSNSQPHLKFNHLNIPSSVLEISVLYHLESHLQKVILPQRSNLKQLRPASFFCIDSIKLVLIPRSVLKISQHAFCSSGLTHVIFSRNASVTSLDNSTFKNTANLGSVVIPKSVETIDKDCFFQSKLHSLILPSDSKLKQVGSRVFGNCENLTNLEISPPFQLRFPLSKCQIQSE